MAAQRHGQQDASCGGDARARMSVFVRPLRTTRYMDPQLRASELFDVILTAGTTSLATPFLYVERSPRDFAQLQRELEHEVEDSGSSSHGLTTPLVITPVIEAYLASQGGNESTEAAVASEQFCRNTTVEFEERFAWQLDHFLTALVNHADVRVRNSRALKRFIRGGSEPLSLEDRVAIDKWLVGSGGQSAAAVVNERIPSGCSVEHSTRVQVDDGEGSLQQHAQSLVLWRFALQGKNVLFSARFTEQDQAKDGKDDDTADGYDPYAASDPYNVSADDAGDEDGGEDDEAIMAHYPTYYSFPAPNEGDNTSLQYEYGYFLATASGDLVLEWKNADSTSILSKPLTFQVRVLPLVEATNKLDSASSEVVKKLVRKLSGVEGRDSVAGDEEDAFWLQQLIMTSTITSLEQFFGQSDDDYDDAAFAGLTLDTPHDSVGGSGNDDERGRQTEMLKRAQEEKHFYEQRAREFEERTAQLEGALRATKSELKKAQDAITISEEIYKASLETITQLEVAASQQKPSASQNASASLEIPSLLSSQAASTPSPRDVEENAVKAKDGVVVSDKEHQRVVNLCTTFQEQCLWRSIELGESEKRNMVLEAKLQDSKQEKAELQAQTTSLEEMIAALQVEVKKLKTHKSILVQEVKKLQPYSQINLTALVQEAQEARMMQRSLQAQLDSRDVVESATSTTSAAALAIAAEEDGAGGGFVVVESDEHSSFFHETAPRQ